MFNLIVAWVLLRPSLQLDVWIAAAGELHKTLSLEAALLNIRTYQHSETAATTSYILRYIRLLTDILPPLRVNH